MSSGIFEKRARMTSPAVARSLRAGLAALAKELPTDMSTPDEVAAYRALSASRSVAPEVLAAQWGIRITDGPDVAGHAVSVVALPNPRMRVLFLHGGGLIAGNRFDGLDVVARHAGALNTEVWTLEYPLTPEANFDEMIAVVLTAIEAARADGLPLVLAGQSAGGGLAAAAALAAPVGALAGLLLVCPMLERRDRPAMTQFASDVSWSPVSNTTAWATALQGATAVPAGEVPDLRTLPPTFLDTGTAEIFRDGIIDFASRALAQDVAVELHVWSGAFHASDCVIEAAPVSKQAHRARADWLARLQAGDV